MPGQNSKAKTSNDYGAYLLLKLTAELIRNTNAYTSSIIKSEVKTSEKVETQIVKQAQEFQKTHKQQVKKLVRQKISAESHHLSKLNKRTVEMGNINPFQEFFAQRAVQAQRRTMPLMPQIPESMLPPTVQHIKPMPQPIEANLGKLMPVVRDPFVKIIECNGPGENIVVIGTMGRKKTGIVLNKEEIDGAIASFSQATKIPINEGVFKVVFGRLILSAVISEIIGSKFIIRKMGV